MAPIRNGKPGDNTAGVIDTASRTPARPPINLYWSLCRQRSRPNTHIRCPLYVSTRRTLSVNLTAQNTLVRVVILLLHIAHKYLSHLKRYCFDTLARL